MQVMGTVARELGFEGPMPQLCEPNIGIYYGCKKLFDLNRRHLTIMDALAAYNAGSPDSPAGRKYAIKVSEKWKSLSPSLCPTR